MTRVDGSKIRALRTEREQSVEQLAVAAGISPTTMRNIEKGTNRKPKPPFVAAIAAALDVSVDDITVDSGEPSAVSA